MNPRASLAAAAAVALGAVLAMRAALRAGKGTPASAGGAGGAPPAPSSSRAAIPGQDRTPPAQIKGVPSVTVDPATVRELADRLRRIGPEVAGHPLSDAEVAAALVVAGVESGFCRWKLGVDGERDNCGSIQCLMTERKNPPPWLRCTGGGDKDVNGTGYKTQFAHYTDAPGPDGKMRPAGDWAAYHLLRHLYVHRPWTAKALARGVSLWTILDWLHREGYYAGEKKPNEDPVDNYTAAGAARLPGILAALGAAPDALKIGTVVT